MPKSIKLLLLSLKITRGILIALFYLGSFIALSALFFFDAWHWQGMDSFANSANARILAVIFFTLMIGALSMALKEIIDTTELTLDEKSSEISS